MSLLKNAYTIRRNKRLSLCKEEPYLSIYSRPEIPIDPVIESDHFIGYRSPQSKVIHITNGRLRLGIKGIRAFWAYLYGVNPSGSPKRISSLLEYIHDPKGKEGVDGWQINDNPNPSSSYVAVVTHKPKCIKMATNNVTLLIRLLNKVNPDDGSIWRISYRDLRL